MLSERIAAKHNGGASWLIAAASCCWTIVYEDGGGCSACQCCMIVGTIRCAAAPVAALVLPGPGDPRIRPSRCVLGSTGSMFHARTARQSDPNMIEGPSVGTPTTCMGEMRGGGWGSNDPPAGLEDSFRHRSSPKREPDLEEEFDGESWLIWRIWRWNWQGGGVDVRCVD